MPGIILNGKRLPVAVGELELQRNKIASIPICHTSKIAKRKRELPGRVIDGAPEIDDLVSFGKEIRDVRFGKMEVNATFCSRSSLEDRLNEIIMRFARCGPTWSTWTCFAGPRVSGVSSVPAGRGRRIAKYRLIQLIP